MQPLLLLLAILLTPRAGTEEIIGGHEAKANSRPYMAFVESVTEGRKMRCGGVLVQKDFVLTAAHCLKSSITVTLGAHNINKQEKTQQVIPVKRAIPHPDHNNMANDIMLLQLQRKAKKNQAVKPLGLPKSKNQVKPGQVCSMAGWGRDQRMVLPDTLQEVELTVQKDKECESLFPGNYTRDTQICAGDPTKKKAGFKGDSGGPLVCGKVVQGIFSSGRRNR
ncbi:PREDICTED: granzyme H, partial [Condylura cristata]|uniref:granzyme H n=1 Tax=Condylura cristata TaxID=143302 RepID=UPI0006430BEE